MTYTKDPDATLDYAFDWSDWLETGESIVSVVIDIDSGLTENTGDREVGSEVVKIWVTGGSVGERYAASCEITTDNTPARIDERTIYLEIMNR